MRGLAVNDVFSTNEICNDGLSFVRRVFDYPMPYVRKAMYVCVRPDSDEAIKAIRTEAPILHSPDQATGTIRKPWQQVLDRMQSAP